MPPGVFVSRNDGFWTQSGKTTDRKSLLEWDGPAVRCPVAVSLKTEAVAGTGSTR
jgi:hypothetical protein